MSTAPTKVVHQSITFDELIDAAIAQHRRRDTVEYHLERGAGALLALAAIVALAAVLLGHIHLWVQLTVIGMLTVGIVALAVLRIRVYGRRLDAAVARLLGR